ncbi:MAG TPA: FCD domain-containing protein [Anaerolineales bacterium]|nr:FCD domain-containing protein [Anaerolineales bacterium]
MSERSPRSNGGGPSDFLSYMMDRGAKPGERLPATSELARSLGVSTAKLREQMEVAQALGLVEIRPKTGIRVLPFDFMPALRLAARFALAQDPSHFEDIGTLRNHIEAAFWFEAVPRLLPEDHRRLEALVQAAWIKLQGDPIQIPHAEHRELHLTVFYRLENPFVRGILEIYWEAYEAVGLSMYADYAYLKEVWEHHQAMVEAIVRGDLAAGYQALVAHTGLLQSRPEAAPSSEQAVSRSVNA